MPSLETSPAISRPPRIRVVPDGADITWGLAAIKLAKVCLVKPYDWQEDIINSWLARKDDLYACATCGAIIPRQNGKTKAVVASRLLFGALILGEAIRYSAHRVDAMLEMFDIFLDVLGDPRIPEDDWNNQEVTKELHEKVKKFNFNNGHQKIEFKNGGFIRFVSRSTGAGRGSTVDVNVYDEAQFLTNDQVAASAPNQSAGPKKNPQEIYIGTPPSEPGCDAEPFSRVRDAAINGEDGFCWHEWSVEEPGNITDKARWYETNPSLGLSLMERSVEGELVTLGPLKFAIERLGWWPKSMSNKVIDAKKWDETSSKVAPTKEDVDRYAVGVKFTPDGTRACMCLAAKLKNGSCYVEMREDVQVQLEGVDALVKFIAEGKNKLAVLAIDGKAGGKDLQERCIEAGLLKRASMIMATGDVVAAASKLVLMLTDKTLTHCPDEELDASAKSVIRRKIGRDGYGFGGNSCPVEAAAAAVWAVMTTKRKPGRKMRLL